MSVERPPRRRRSPEEAERTILAARKSYLFGGATVQGDAYRRGDGRTGLSRPALYAYFRDRYGLVTWMLEGIGGLLFRVDRRWLAGGDGEGRD